MALLDCVWGAVTKFRIRGCKHCHGRNSVFDVKENSKSKSAPACRQGLRYRQILRQGVRVSRFCSRALDVVRTERRNEPTVTDKSPVKDVQGESQSGQQAFLASALQSASRPTVPTLTWLRMARLWSTWVISTRGRKASEINSMTEELTWRHEVFATKNESWHERGL